jgi:hypothetical protein
MSTLVGLVIGYDTRGSRDGGDIAVGSHVLFKKTCNFDAFSDNEHICGQLTPQYYGAHSWQLFCKNRTGSICEYISLAVMLYLMLFSQVKIMWPRTDNIVGPGADITSSRRTKSTGLSGFVSYMKRKDAEVAVHEMDGFDWNGHVLRVGWSKAVPIGPKAAYGR